MNLETLQSLEKTDTTVLKAVVIEKNNKNKSSPKHQAR